VSSSEAERAENLLRKDPLPRPTSGELQVRKGAIRDGVLGRRGHSGDMDKDAFPLLSARTCWMEAEIRDCQANKAPK